MSVGQRLLHFWFVWSVLLLAHETGHAWTAAAQGEQVQGITVGAGPILWRDELASVAVTFRLLPVVGWTRVTALDTAAAAPRTLVKRQVAVLGGGFIATALLGVLIAGVVIAWERVCGHRHVWGRMIVADAAILTLVNLLPVPPLDGGRAVISLLGAAAGSPLSGGTLLWVQLGGLALAVLPMTVWTRWTARVDRAAWSWLAPGPRTPHPTR